MHSEVAKFEWQMPYELSYSASHRIHVNGMDSNQWCGLCRNIALLFNWILGVFYICFGIFMVKRYQFRFLAEFQNDGHENRTQ